MAHAVSAHTPSLVATILAVGPAERMQETAATLDALRAEAAVRTVIVTLGSNGQPEVKTTGDTTVVEGILPRYLNNLVASLRLSSLPSLAWWRGGEAAVLGDLASLVDRLVLDSLDPRTDWTTAVDLKERALISDLRWTKLTRWRNLMAQFFDRPDVRADAASLTSLDIIAADHHAAGLFSGWLTSSLPNGAAIRTSVAQSPSGHFMHSISLNGAGHAIRLELSRSLSCVETSISRPGQAVVTRVVPLGDQSLGALLTEELRVRSRDEAFERAVAAVVTQ